MIKKYLLGFLRLFIVLSVPNRGTKYILCLFFVFTVASFFNVGMPSAKEGAKKSEYKLNGQTYLKNDLIYGFIKTAFSRHLWIESYMPKNHHFTGRLTCLQEDLQQHQKKDQNKTCFEQGVKFDALNRWAKDITVGVGMPPTFDEEYNRDSDILQADYNAVGPQAVDLVSEIVTKMAPSIIDATGLKVRFIPPSEETTEHFADIRILLYEKRFGAYNKFKILPHKIVGDFTAPRPEQYIGNQAVRFTPMASSQVEGYYVPDADNHIEYARCYIWPDHKTDMQKSLIAECLLRSLGLPETVYNIDDSLLSDWNKKLGTISKNILKEGFSANPSRQDLLADEAWAKLEEKDDVVNHISRRIENYDERPSEYDQVGKTPVFPSDYDLRLLSMLYCEEIGAGMGRYEAIAALNQGHCY